jgi:ATP-binding cassette subfamily B protein/subfamily B ATP-binding cassette protein MsbA
MLRGHRGRLSLAIGLLTISTVLGLVPLYGTKIVFDHVLDDKPFDPVIAWMGLPTEPKTLLAVTAVVMISLAFVSMLVSNYSRWQATRISKRVTVQSRRRAFAHAVRLPLPRVQQMKSGGLTSTLRDDAGGIGELVFSMLYNPSRALVQLLGSLVILTLVDWRLLAGSLLLLPTVWVTHRTWISRIRPIFRDIRGTRTATDGRVTESFAGMRIVRSFARQSTETVTYAKGNHLQARQEVLAWWWSRGVEAAWGVLIPLATALLLWYGSVRILDDRAAMAAGTITTARALTTGDLVMFMGYVAALLGPIAALAQAAAGLQNNLAGLDRTLDLLAEPTEFPTESGQTVVTRETTAGRVTFEGVSFAYKAGGPLVLKDVSLDVPAGSTVALIGASGAGKTTMCNLVARFYDPTAGRVLLDGRDLKAVEVDSFRRLLGIVEQDTFLFDGTIAENIGYGRRGASRDEIIAAAKVAAAHEFISGFEKGYETYVGERGVRLSGGQRQRLTIARAVLADPRILILDEATSNLDSESERHIQDALAGLMRGRTCFVIAHRLSTIAGADLIVLIEDGQITQRGTHDELMASSERYRYMVELQTTPAGKAK